MLSSEGFENSSSGHQVWLRVGQVVGWCGYFLTRLVTMIHAILLTGGFEAKVASVMKSAKHPTWLDVKDYQTLSTDQEKG